MSGRIQGGTKLFASVAGQKKRRGKNNPVYSITFYTITRKLVMPCISVKLMYTYKSGTVIFKDKKRIIKEIHNESKH